jgi:hypothetical protein
MVNALHVVCAEVRVRQERIIQTERETEKFDASIAELKRKKQALFMLLKQGIFSHFLVLFFSSNDSWHTFKLCHSFEGAKGEKAECRHSVHGSV